MADGYISYRARQLRPRARSLRRNSPPAERKLWFESLRDLPQKFTRQKPLAAYIADFYCSSHKLVIELDGDSHFTDSAQDHDGARTTDLARHGIRVLRFTNADVMQRFEAVCLEVSRTLEES